MLGYRLTVIDGDTHQAVETAHYPTAATVMAAIPDLLAKHPGCERIKVHVGALFLFSVDCAGETLPD